MCNRKSFLYINAIILPCHYVTNKFRKFDLGNLLRVELPVNSMDMGYTLIGEFVVVCDYINFGTVITITTHYIDMGKLISLTWDRANISLLLDALLKLM